MSNARRCSGASRLACASPTIGPSHDLRRRLDLAATLFLPASKINGAQIDHAIISDGCIIKHATIQESIIGIRSIIGPGTSLRRTIIMGSDDYESTEDAAGGAASGVPPLGIGENTRIENAIIDKNVEVPEGEQVGVDLEQDRARGMTVSPNGVVTIPKGFKFD